MEEKSAFRRLATVALAAAVAFALLALCLGGCVNGGDSDVVQVESSAKSAQYCSRITKIVPCYSDGTPIDKYRVHIERVGDDTLFPELGVDGPSGFTVNDFTGTPVGGGKNAVLVDGEYELEMKDQAIGITCRLRVLYRYGAKDAPDRIEVTP